MRTSIFFDPSKVNPAALINESEEEQNNTMILLYYYKADQFLVLTVIACSTLQLYCMNIFAEV